MQPGTNPMLMYRGGKPPEHFSQQPNPGMGQQPSGQMVNQPGMMYNRMPEYMMNLNTRPRPAYTPVLPRAPDLVRRPIHSYLASPKASSPAPTTSFRSKVMTVLGLNPYNSVPPGLRNEGQNLCFMNSVLQCLAHTPGLHACLAQHKRNPAVTPPEETLVLRLSDVLKQLDVAPGTSELTVVDTGKLRLAASMLPHSMVLHPQQQASILQNYRRYILTVTRRSNT